MPPCPAQLQSLVCLFLSSAGAVLLFCKAHEQLGDPAYLEAAQRSGEAVWQRGLLKKVGGLGSWRWTDCSLRMT